jgi:hypothetical protein
MLSDEQLKELTKGSRQSLLFMRKVAKTQEEETTRIFKQITWCAYCGQEFPLDTVTADQIGEHIQNCEKHPLYQANKEIVRLREGWTHCTDLCQQYEKMMEEMKQDNTSMAEHNVELETNLEALRINQCSMCTLWQNMKHEPHFTELKDNLVEENWNSAESYLRKREFLKLPIEERRKILKKQAEEFNLLNPDYYKEST